MPSDGQRDIGGMAVAAVMIVIGLVFLWDTTNLVDSDSVVFPRTVIFGMILFSIMFIVWNFLRPSGADTEGVQGGSTPRRIGLVAAMLGCAFLMPYTGFLLSGLAAFMVIMLLAMHEGWTRGRLIVYPLIGLAVVLGFYGLFAKALLVPLPEAPFL